MQGHAFSIDVVTANAVERFWVIDTNEINAINVLKGIGLSPKAVIKLKDQVPDKLAPELGLNLSAIGTYGHRNNSN